MAKPLGRREFLGLTAAGTAGLLGASLWTKAWAVVLADDLNAVAPSKIKDVEIVRTVVGGKTVYQA